MALGAMRQENTAQHDACPLRRSEARIMPRPLEPAQFQRHSSGRRNGIRSLRLMLGPIITLLCAGIPGGASAQDRAGEEEGPHHLSIIAGATIIDAQESESAFTLGLDYEYRVSDRLGLGVVVEHAFGPIESTTLLAVADIHLWKGLAIQTGPGVEFIDDKEEAFVLRLGALYEWELGDGFTVSPQVHYDFSDAEDAVVVAIGFGRAF